MQAFHVMALCSLLAGAVLTVGARQGAQIVCGKLKCDVKAAITLTWPWQDCQQLLYHC